MDLLGLTIYSQVYVSQANDRGNLTPVVRKVDDAIHRINHYPVDSLVYFVNTYPLDGDLSAA